MERTTDLRKVLEECIFDNKVELSLREVLGITKKEFHDSIVDLVKRKRLSTEPKPEEAGGSANDVPRGHGSRRRVGGDPLFEAALGQSNHGVPC